MVCTRSEDTLADYLADLVVRDSAPIRRSLVMRPEGSTELTPLGRLLRTQGEVGGKGAGLRITLLMSLIWVCAREPYSTSRVAPYWAQLLGREDPRGEGARVIRDCLRDLQQRGLIDLRSQGSRLEIKLNLETSSPGNPEPYVPPYDREPYLSVPRAFWSSGVAGEVSGAAAAMYLVALTLTRNESPDFFLAGDYFDSRYGISRSSRKRGLAELEKLGVLTVTAQEALNVSTFRTTRRNVYTLAPAFNQPPAKTIEVESGSTVEGEGPADPSSSKDGELPIAPRK